MIHSSGSVPHAWMLKAYPQLLKRNCFVDPVTFCLWEGDVCYNFVYKRPTNVSSFVWSWSDVTYTLSRVWTS